uniref:Transmembrane protein 240b n=1 Tax=Acanthochromis polyacanthus TaxID=80966 RepID=A0A3Q1FSL1_9TELE
MNALLLRFHNFIFPLWLGEDRVCKCFCGSQQVYHVVPYEGAMSAVDSSETFFGSDIMTQLNMDVIVGLFLGILLTWLLMWLNSVWKSASQLNNIHLWSRIPTLYTIVNVLTGRHPKDTEDLQQEHTAEQPIWTNS